MIRRANIDHMLRAAGDLTALALARYRQPGPGNHGRQDQDPARATEVRRPLARVGAVLVALLLIGAAAPEGRLAQYQRLRREAVAAVQAGDLATAETRLTAALELYPDVPGSFVRLARVLAAEGKHDKAIVALEAYAYAGLTYDVAGDPALKVLVGRPDFAPVAARLAKNAEPEGDGWKTWTLDTEPEFIAEGIAKDGESWLISGVSGRSILLLADAGTTPFLRPDSQTGALFGMAVDQMHGVLWVAEALGEGVPGSSGESRTGLLKVSLKTGKVMARVFVPSAGEKHQLGDVTVAADGTVYASDSVAGGVYRLKAGSSKLELFVEPGAMASPQGLVICPGEQAMVVADYSTGLHRVDLETGKTDLLIGDGYGLAGTDGVALLPSGPGAVMLALSQNGVSPQRVVEVHLDAECRAFMSSPRLIGASLPDMDDLTLLAVDGDFVVVITHGRWAARGEDGKLTRVDPGPIKIRKLRWSTWSLVG